MNTSNRQKLINAINNRPKDHNEILLEIKQSANEIKQKEDWLWHLLLSSFSTLGNIRGYEGVILNKENYDRLNFNKLIKLDQDKRMKLIEEIFRKAKVRRAKIKTHWLCTNIDLIIQLGGLKVVQEFIRQAKGRFAKTRIMKLFEGIGEKYSRNIFMDICDPDFDSSIAVDERLKNILEKLDINNKNYIENENLFLEIARECNLTGWELDRLLFSFNKYYCDRMV